MQRLRRKWYGFRDFFRRGKRGWAASDTWEMNYYLARVLSEMLDYKAEHDMSYPSTHTPESWAEDLRAAATWFHRYAYMDELEYEGDIDAHWAREEEIRANVRDIALPWLTKHFDTLWD